MSAVWPNAESAANSDPWLLANHDRIRLMQPRALAINFVHGLSEPEARRRFEALCRAARVLALARQGPAPRRLPDAHVAALPPRLAAADVVFY